VCGGLHPRRPPPQRPAALGGGARAGCGGLHRCDEAGLHHEFVRRCVVVGGGGSGCDGGGGGGDADVMRTQALLLAQGAGFTDAVKQGYVTNLLGSACSACSSACVVAYCVRVLFH